MTWKIWTGLVLAALIGGFFTGMFIKGHHEAAKAVAAEQQIKALGDQVKQEQQVKQQQAQAVVVAQKQAADSDAKAQALLAKWNNRPKPLPALPIIPNETPLPVVSNDDLANQTIQALSQDVENYKAVNLKLTAELATANTIINDQAKQLVLSKIALDAQVAANNSARWSGRFQGAGITVGITGAVVLGHKLKLF
jgi:Flp pilus assembly protein TadG